MKSISSTQYLSFLGSFGLSLTPETGGQQMVSPTECVIEVADEIPNMTISDNAPIAFLPPDIFLRTIHATEESLKVRLFN